MHICHLPLVVAICQPKLSIMFCWPLPLYVIGFNVVYTAVTGCHASFEAVAQDAFVFSTPPPVCDCRQLNETYLDNLGVKMLPGWEDPWGER